MGIHATFSYIKTQKNVRDSHKPRTFRFVSVQQTRRLLGVDIIYIKEIAVADVEAVTGDDGVGPGEAFAAFGNLELAYQFMAFGRGLDETELSLLFGESVKACLRRQ